MKNQNESAITPDTTRIYNAIVAILADRKSRSSAIKSSLIMRKARYGLKGVEAAQTELHTLGLLDIELDEWNEAEPMQSRFRYSLPSSD